MSKTIKNSIDTRLAHLKISNELKNKIIDTSKKKRVISKRRYTIGIAAALCVLLSISVMASAVPNFEKLLSMVGPKIAQNLKPIRLTSEDNGIKMEVLAAMSDSDTAVVYISMHDLNADRVDDSIDLYNYSITGLNLLTSEVISYDRASKTAIIRILANGGKKLNGKKVTLNIESFLSDKKVYGLFDTGIDLKKATRAYDKNTITLNMQNVSGGSGSFFEKFKEEGTISILKPDKLKIDLPNINFAHISNIGMIDGLLHIQTKWTGDGIDDHGTLVLIDNSGNRINPSNIYFGIDEYGNTKYGREYVEYVFQVNDTVVKKYKINGDSFTTAGQYTEGKWQNTFKIEAVEKGTEVNCDLNMNGIIINKVSVSPLGVSLIGTGSKTDNTNDINVSVRTKNGSVLDLESAVKQNEDGKFVCKYMPLEPIKVTDIKEVYINGIAVEIN